MRYLLLTSPAILPRRYRRLAPRSIPVLIGTRRPTRSLGNTYVRVIDLRILEVQPRPVDHHDRAGHRRPHAGEHPRLALVRAHQDRQPG